MDLLLRPKGPFRIVENSHVSRCPFVATLLWAIPFWTQCQDRLPMADGFHEIWDVPAREKALTSSVDDKEHEFPGLICLPRPIASSYLTFAVISAVQKSGNTPNSLVVSDQIAILRSTSYFYLCKRKHPIFGYCCQHAANQLKSLEKSTECDVRPFLIAECCQPKAELRENRLLHMPAPLNPHSCSSS